MHRNLLTRVLFLLCLLTLLATTAHASQTRTAFACTHRCDWLDGNPCGVDHVGWHVYHQGAYYTCDSNGQEGTVWLDYQWWFDWQLTYG